MGLPKALKLQYPWNRTVDNLIVRHGSSSHHQNRFRIDVGAVHSYDLRRQGSGAPKTSAEWVVKTILDIFGGLLDLYGFIIWHIDKY